MNLQSTVRCQTEACTLTHKTLKCASGPAWQLSRRTSSHFQMLPTTLSTSHEPEMPYDKIPSEHCSDEISPDFVVRFCYVKV